MLKFVVDKDCGDGIAGAYRGANEDVVIEFDVE